MNITDLKDEYKSFEIRRKRNILNLMYNQRKSAYNMINIDIKVHSRKNWTIQKFVSQSPICLLSGFGLIFPAQISTMDIFCNFSLK